MVELYKEKGFSHDDATNLVDIISRNKEVFIDTMMVEELGLLPPDPNASPAKHGVITFISFCINGLVPLLTFIIASIVSNSRGGESIDFMFLFWISCALTVYLPFTRGGKVVFSLSLMEQ